MDKFINLRNTNHTPIMMNMAGLSVIVEQKEDHGDGKEKNLLALYGEERGQFFLADTQEWNIDTHSFIARVFDEGIDIFALPYVWGDEKVGRFFVNPEKVQSIIVSGERQKDDEREPHVGLLVDVKGYGRVETYRVPASTVDAFVQAVEAVNPNMIRYESEDISTRWGPEGFTMIDPTEVRSIFPNGWDMDIKFKDGARLDFHLDRQNKTEKARSDYLQRLVKRIQGNGTRDDLFKAVDGDLNNLLPRLSKYEERYRKKLRKSFAEALAKKVPDIVEIKGANNIYYTTLDDVSWVKAHKDALSIYFNKASEQRYADDLTAWYSCPKDAISEMERLTEIMHKKSNTR